MSDDNLANLTVEILKDIRQGVQGLRTDTNERFERMEERSERIEQATIAGFAGVHERLEDGVGVTNKVHITCSFEQRLGALERLRRECIVG